MAESQKKAEIATDILQEETLDNIHHVNNPVLDVPAVEKKYLNAILSYSKQGNVFVFTDGKASVEIKVFSDEIIRVRLAPRSQFLEDFSYAIKKDLDLHPTSFTLVETDDAFQIKTSAVVCQLQKKDFLVSFETLEGKVMNADQQPMHWEENPEFGGYYVYCTKDTPEDEAFFGLGDKSTNLNLRGKRFQNWNSDTYGFGFNQDPLYKTIPFYVGITDGDAYGIFFDNTFKTYFDFAAERPDQTSYWSEGGELQYYYLHGPQMIDVVKRYHELTGTHDMPPLWAIGYHQCRWSYYPEANVREVAREFRKRQIPCDAIYLDIDYMDGYRCFTWNKRYFPDPRKMISDLAADGFRTVVMIDPGIKVDEDYWVFNEGKEKKYFCRRGDDYYMEGYVWPGPCQFPDYTNPKVREWWGTLYRGLVEDGVAGVWNDMNEPAVFGRGTFPDDVRHYFEGLRGSHRKAHNIYGMQMVRSTFEGLKKLQKNRRPFTITRAAYAGVQRYSSVWTGDNIATWEHLKIGTLQLQRLSVSGLSFCGTDIGGFTGEPDGELYTRWMQFGVFSPFMRVHSAGDTRDREPWSFGPEWEAICKKFIELRYQLLPYFYTVFWRQYKYKEPILRPISLLEQHKPENLQREEEFAFGHHILVSPVIQPGQQSKIVYLPEGNWYYYFDHAVLEGGQEHIVETPLNEMPIFIRGGSIIPEFPIMQYTMEKNIDALKLNVFWAPGRHESHIYVDHGETFAYEQSVYNEKYFIVEGEQNSLTIVQHTEGMYHERFDNYKIYVIGLPFDGNHVEVDGDVLEMLVEEDGKHYVEVEKEFRRLTISK